MQQIFTRLYATAADAERVMAMLRTYGQPMDEVQLTRPGGDAAATEASILKGHVPKKHVATYAAGVANGGTLLSVNALFGHGNQILRLLAKGNPIDDGVPVVSAARRSTDDASPLSDALGLPVLIRSAPRGLILPLLTGNGGAYTPSIPLPTLSGTGGPYKGVIPMPLLSPSGPTIPLPMLTNTSGGYKPVIPLPTLINQH